MIVTDGSDEEQWAAINASTKDQELSRRPTMLHSSYDTPLSERLAEALSLVDTPYVMLAADDDLYFPDWLEAGVSLLDTDASFGVVYGHTVQFEIADYQPFGRLQRFCIKEEKNPPPRWLEGYTVFERLEELGRPETDLATVGWYALQRTDLLKTIVTKSVENNFDGYLMEKFLIFCQAALFRTRMIDRIFLARQTNNREQRPPFSFQKEQAGLARLKQASAQLLTEQAGVAESSAFELVGSFYSGDIAQLKRADSKELLRRLANSLPLVRAAWDATARSVGFHKRHLRDPRFPSAPTISEEHPAVVALARAASLEADIKLPQ